MKKVFEDIYDTNKWGRGKGKGSGEGSHPGNTTEYRKFLTSFMKEHNVKSILDVGCGDWQFSHLIDWNGIEYTGFDIVENVIQKNNFEYASINIRFYCKDACSSKLPMADMILIKDVMQHWSIPQIIGFLPKLKGFKYILIVNCGFESELLNQDIEDGGFRPLDLRKYPFNINAQDVFSFHTDHSVFDPNFKHKKVLLIKQKDLKNIYQKCRIISLKSRFTRIKKKCVQRLRRCFK